MPTPTIPMTPSERARLKGDIATIITEEFAILLDGAAPEDEQKLIYLCAEKIVAAFAVDLFEQPQDPLHPYIGRI